jgi:hypothetical protein
VAIHEKALAALAAEEKASAPDQAAANEQAIAIGELVEQLKTCASNKVTALCDAKRRAQDARDEFLARVAARTDRVEAAHAAVVEAQRVVLRERLGLRKLELLELDAEVVSRAEAAEAAIGDVLDRLARACSEASDMQRQVDADAGTTSGIGLPPDLSTAFLNVATRCPQGMNVVARVGAVLHYARVDGPAMTADAKALSERNADRAEIVYAEGQLTPCGRVERLSGARNAGMALIDGPKAPAIELAPGTIPSQVGLLP